MTATCCPSFQKIQSLPACCSAPVRSFVVSRLCRTCLRLRPAFEGPRTISKDETQNGAMNHDER